MVPCLLARKERMMQRCAAIMKERTLKSMSSRWCHLYPSNSCPNSLPPTCEKAAELDTGSVLVRKGGCGSRSRTKSDLEEGIITISASGSLSLCETTAGSPSTNPALIPSSSQMWDRTPVCWKFPAVLLPSSPLLQLADISLQGIQKSVWRRRKIIH